MASQYLGAFLGSAVVFGAYLGQFSDARLWRILQWNQASCAVCVVLNKWRQTSKKAFFWVKHTELSYLHVSDALNDFDPDRTTPLTAGIWATYPQDYLTWAGGLFDQVSFQHDILRNRFVKNARPRFWSDRQKGFRVTPKWETLTLSSGSKDHASNQQTTQRCVLVTCESTLTSADNWNRLVTALGDGSDRWQKHCAAQRHDSAARRLHRHFYRTVIWLQLRLRHQPRKRLWATTFHFSGWLRGWALQVHEVIWHQFSDCMGLCWDQKHKANLKRQNNPSGLSQGPLHVTDQENNSKCPRITAQIAQNSLTVSETTTGFGFPSLGPTLEPWSEPGCTWSVLAHTLVTRILIIRKQGKKVG